MPSDICLSTFNFIDLSYFESVSFVLESDKQRDVYLGLALNNSNSFLSIYFIWKLVVRRVNKRTIYFSIIRSIVSFLVSQVDLSWTWTNYFCIFIQDVSTHCASQPEVRGIAKSTGNISTGKPRLW